MGFKFQNRPGVVPARPSTLSRVVRHRVDELGIPLSMEEVSQLTAVYATLDEQVAALHTDQANELLAHASDPTP